MDTIIFAVLMIAAIQAARGARGKVVISLFMAGLVLTAVLFAIHTTSALNLNF